MQTTVEPPVQDQQTEEHWTFHQEEDAPQPASAGQAPPDEPVTWTASEFVAHHKDAGWYFLLFLAVTVICGLTYVFTKDLISVIAIVIVVSLYTIVSSAKPKQRTYQITAQGISIDQKFYPFSSFKSFNIPQGGAIGRVVLVPLKRLMPEIELYIPPENAQNIIEVLSRSLPNDQSKDRGMDRLLDRLHF